MTPALPPELPAGKESAAVRAMFDFIAPRYDLLNHLLSLHQDRGWRRRGVRLLKPQAGERVLDLCCGTGDLALHCRAQRPGCTVVGADFSLAMLQGACAKTGGQQARMLWTGADGLRLPFGDAAFDAAMCAFGVRNLSDTAAGLRELARVVRPGGRLLVLEFMKPTNPLLQYGFGLFFRRVLPVVGRTVSRHQFAYQYLPASVEGFYTRQEFTGLLRECGWPAVRSISYSGGIATAFLAHKLPGSAPE